jgi:hypothetical protein
MKRREDFYLPCPYQKLFLSPVRERVKLFSWFEAALRAWDITKSPSLTGRRIERVLGRV